MNRRQAVYICCLFLFFFLFDGALFQVFRPRPGSIAGAGVVDVWRPAGALFLLAAARLFRSITSPFRTHAQLLSLGPRRFLFSPTSLPWLAVFKPKIAPAPWSLSTTVCKDAERRFFPSGCTWRAPRCPSDFPEMSLGSYESRRGCWRFLDQRAPFLPRRPAPTAPFLFDRADCSCQGSALSTRPLRPVLAIFGGTFPSPDKGTSFLFDSVAHPRPGTAPRIIRMPFFPAHFQVQGFRDERTTFPERAAGSWRFSVELLLRWRPDPRFSQDAAVPPLFRPLTIEVFLRRTGRRRLDSISPVFFSLRGVTRTSFPLPGVAGFSR